MNRRQKLAAGVLAGLFELATIGLTLDLAAVVENGSRRSAITIEQGPYSTSGSQFFVAASGGSFFSRKSAVEIDQETYGQMSEAWRRWLDQTKNSFGTSFGKTFDCEVKGGFITTPFARDCHPR
jgi:hypothetical protein